jgi:Uma2 family endonuclease
VIWDGANPDTFQPETTVSCAKIFLVMGNLPLVTMPHVKKGKAIPQWLIYEVIDGQPVYHKGYREVLNKTKTFADIMGCSSLQFVLVDYLQQILYAAGVSRRYWIASNEAGLHIELRNNLSTDIALYDKTVLTPARISNRYADVPPALAIEIDTDGEVSLTETGFSEQDYVFIKTRKLLEFGTQRVIWIFSNTHKVMVAEPGKDWLTKDWHQTIELWEGHTFNIARFLEQEGINL